MRTFITTLSLLCALGSMASTPQIRVMQPDNFPIVQKENSPVRFKAKSSTEDVPLKIETERPIHPVNIKIIKGKLSQGIMIFYFDETGFNMLEPEEDFIYDETSGICTANLPEGMIDVVVEFNNLYINEEVGYFVNRGSSYYFIDDVIVNENTPELKADANECTMLPLSFVMANGNPIEFATKNWEGTEMGAENGGNCPSGASDYIFYNSKYKANGNQIMASGVPTYYTNFGLDPDNDNPISYWIPSCNKASGRWAFIFKINTFTTDLEGGYIAAAINPSSDPISVTLSDYSKLDWNFAETDFKGIEYDFGIAFNESSTKLETTSQIKIDTPLDMSTAVINNADGINNLSLMEQTKCALAIDNSDPDWPWFFGILDPMSNTDHTARYFHPATYMFTAKPWTDETKYREYLPEYTWGNEYSNYSQAALAMKFGDSTPFLATNVWRNEDHDTGATTGFSLSSYIIDLAGTFRTDWDKLQSEVYFNGRLVKDKETDLDEFQNSWNPSEEGFGKMKYVLTDTPDFRIDGMQPINITEISYDQSLSTWEPPTLTSLLFKNSDGKITNRIETGKNAVIELFAGGMKFIQYWYFHPYAQRYFSNGTVTITYDVTPSIEYAPYGSEEWRALDISQNETERSAALGNHYLVDLGNVTTGSGDGWYDLRITLTTPEGNTQIQTLSPAFNIADMAGIEEISFTPDEHRQVRYFDLQGTRIANPVPGQTVIKVSNRGASKIRF